MTEFSFKFVFVIAHAELDPRLSQCMHTAVSNTTKRRQPNGYPACVYTRQELVKMVALMQPEFTHYNYTVPEECEAVWAGTELGGREAVVPPPKSPQALQAEAMFRQRMCADKMKHWEDVHACEGTATNSTIATGNDRVTRRR